MYSPDVIWKSELITGLSVLIWGISFCYNLINSVVSLECCGRLLGDLQRHYHVLLLSLLCYFASIISLYPPSSHIFSTYLLNRVACWCCVDSCLELGSGIWHDGNGESLTTEEITTLLLFPHLPSNITDYNPG